jgi:cation diffusion facilitator CzcD-associated flavoprotein CzcO/acetyl esterase/lipase
MSASWPTRIAAWVVRRRVRPALGDMSDIARVRKAFAQLLPAPRGVRYTPAVVGGVAGEWVEGEAGPAFAPAPATTLLYLHGGGFVGCSPRTHRPLTAALALQGLRVFVPDYRLAPEHPFPAAVGDAQAVWRALRSEVAGRLVVAGDSAGGNLALGLMLVLRDAGEALPDAGVLFSPALDFTGGSASMETNAERDAMFPGRQLENLLPHYLAGADAAQPLASPLLGELHGLPPLLVHVGANEVLRDDSLRLADKARAAGVVVQLRIWPGVFHVWQLACWLPEAKRSVRQAADFLHRAVRGRTVEHHDVLIVGAGLSGIGAAAHLQRRCPEKDVAILEARQTLGGTWDLFRYPGVRSDSDMYTLSYEFRPWTGDKAIVDGATIRRYIAETAAERGIDHQIRFGHRVLAGSWSSAEARWMLEVEVRQGDSLRQVSMSCRVLMCCSGYYSYAQGHRPAFPGEAAFRGTLVHPQFWPAGLDHAGKQVLVIGSGATAVTLVPAMARTAAHVTMLQRSPGYVVALPSRDFLARMLRGWLPARWVFHLVRAKNVLVNMLLYALARRRPRQTAARLLAMVRGHLGTAAEQARHFTPSYKPWDQRVCVVPDADLFRAIARGRASVVTDHIQTFTERGVRLQSGQEIAADIVVTATGLELNALGDMALSVDGVRVDVSQAVAYKGVMLSDVPNLVYTFGYTNATWTLKADLTSRWLCRLLRHMDRHHQAVAVARRDPAIGTAPFLDFTSGYVQRAGDRLPRQGTAAPWKVNQNYLADLRTLRFGRIDDGTLSFGIAAKGAGVEAAG